MIEFLTNHIVWWHWVVLGLLLIFLELADGSFLILGLGFAAIIEGIIIYFFKIKFPMQLLSWAIFIVLYFFFWKKFIHSKVKGAKVGQSDAYLGEIGIVIQPISEFHDGRVRFETPVVGSREWIARSDEEINIGTKVKLVKIIGQYAKVEPLENE